MSTYFATKAFVLSFSEAIATELRASGVTVTALCPGPTTTNFAHVANAEKNPMFKKGLPTANDVAVFGYKSLKEKKTVAVHGFTNNILTSVVRVLPKNVVRSVVAQMQKKK
jgi:short-subunit dehydrogenase